MKDCIFCKIVAGEIPSKVVYENDEMLVFEDIDPRAPVHLLFIPREHMSTLNDAGSESAPMLGKMMLKAAELAKELGVDESGYRVLVNCNPEGGQVVFHLHMHLMGGRQMKGMG